MKGRVLAFPPESVLARQKRERDGPPPPPIPGLGVPPKMKRADSRCPNCYLPDLIVAGTVWPMETSYGPMKEIRLGPRQAERVREEVAAQHAFEWPCLAFLDGNGDPSEPIQCRGHWEIQQAVKRARDRAKPRCPVVPMEAR